MDIFVYFLIMKIHMQSVTKRVFHMHTYCAHECFAHLFSRAVL